MRAPSSAEVIDNFNWYFEAFTSTLTENFEERYWNEAVHSDRLLKNTFKLIAKTRLESIEVLIELVNKLLDS